MILIDYSDKRPIYEQIADKFQNLILSGVMEADEKMPSVRSLAIEMSINPNTIQRAYSELERNGFIYSVKGRGNFVRGDDALLDKQRKKLLAELKQQLRTCCNSGITQDEIVQQLEEVYGEVQK